jgi:hypothetical protein
MTDDRIDRLAHAILDAAKGRKLGEIVVAVGCALKRMSDLTDVELEAILHEVAKAARETEVKWITVQ